MGSLTEIPREILLEAPEWDLPTAACHAAIEIDSLRRARPTDLKAVMLLFVKVWNLNGQQALLDKRGDSVGPKALIDPKTAVVVDRAIRAVKASNGGEACMDSQIEGRERVRELFKELLTDPSKFRDLPAEHENAVKLQRVSEFCLALSEEASAYRQQFYSLQPPSSLRS